MFDKKYMILKGGLSGQITWLFFKCFRAIFSLKKQTIQVLLLFNLYFQQKRVPKF